jgi:hypothetical protein
VWRRSCGVIVRNVSSFDWHAVEDEANGNRMWVRKVLKGLGPRVPVGGGLSYLEDDRT